MRRPRQTFLHYLRLQRRRLLLGFLFAFCSGFAAVVPPRFIGEIVDALQAGGAFGSIWPLAGLYVLAAAAENVFRAFARLTILESSRVIEARMRSDLFAHLQRLEPAYFQHQRVGDLMARLTNDLSAVRQMTGPGFTMGGTTIITFGFALASMFALSPKLSLIALVLLPLASLTFAIVGRRVHVRFQRLQATFSDLATKAQESFSGIRVVKAFGREEAEIADFSRIAREYLRHALSLVAMQGAVWPTMSLILGLAVLTALTLGGHDAIEARLTIGQLVQFVAYLQLLSMPMVQIGQISNQVQSGWASLGRLQEIFDAVPAIGDPADAVRTPISGAVEFRHVSFGYGREPVLRDVSFAIPAGGSLGIVGRTGAGKSSLVSLIPRLFDAQEGEIRIDGVDVRRYPLRQLRRAIGFVPQETLLFSLPLRDNVAFGREGDFGDEELRWAGEVSQLNKDVEDFPARYATMIGERGVTLSGGQKQRTALARAVAKNPRILILDDAMSSVDTHTESEILGRLREVMRERTSIIIAHRLSTVKDADLILVLDDGRVAERGSHRELIAQRGLYAQIYRRQLLEQELEVDEEGAAHERRLRVEREPEPRQRPPRDGDLGDVGRGDVG